MTTKVLIADDEPDIVTSTAEFLRRWGFRVDTVSEAPEILAALRRHRPDVLLQDVRMMGMDLTALLRSIRADRAVAGTVVILFTATMSADEMREKVGADDAIEKPFDPVALARLIERHAAHAPAAR